MGILSFIVLSLLGILSMLGALCIFIFEDNEEDWRESSIEVEGYSANPALSCTFSATFSVEFPLDGRGVGTKNFAFAETAGLTDGTDGDWNNFAELRPPWLKVSTYLPHKNEYQFGLATVSKKRKISLVGEGKQHFGPEQDPLNWYSIFRR